MTMWMGKAMGSMFGFMTGGPFGAMIGAFIGHIVDQNMERVFAVSMAMVNPQASSDVQKLFVAGMFHVMGRLAKADGRVSENEIAAANFVMDRMRLAGEARQQAIRYFQEGKNPDFPLDDELRELRTHMTPSLAQMFLEVAMTVAYADGPVRPKEFALVEHVCNLLGITQAQLVAIRKRIEDAMFQSRNGGVSADQQLRQAYRTLGVSADTDDETLKKTYRRLMSQNHPDKLSASGVPEEMIRLAKEKTQEIQMAYAVIRKSRATAAA
jgi:DnaJ like chaperone protein